MSLKVEKVRLIDVDAESSGQRIDNYLMRHLKGVPKSRIYRLIRKGEVRVDGGRIKPSHRVTAGEKVRIPPLRTAQQNQFTIPEERISQVENWVIDEDDDLMILNKPSGIAVHGGSGLTGGVIEALRLARPRTEYLELVHRLDRQTSGCLMVAKNRKTLNTLHDQLRSHRSEHQQGGILKYYLALVRGPWSGEKKRVKVALNTRASRSGERLTVVDQSGRAAESHFSPIRCFSTSTLVEINLLTGRTHQARVHADYLGKPIAGDGKYGDREFNHWLGEQGLKRLFLHASKLVITSPKTGKQRLIEAPLPDELKKVLERLEE
ncbi:MAG: RluA family pseudouridine synthase [Arenicellales bacterium]|jgi:23S rRNA pseudouridine955/2504/2580 synthase|nr:RluA family pseudouridine synthase [Arenicellales bacterium]